MAEISPELAARIEELRTKHEENPAKFFMSLANAYREAGQLSEAESLLREHLKRHPGYLSAHVLLGGCLADRGARDEARNEFHYVLSIDPQNLIALRTLGDMAAAEGKRDEAERWYNEWLAVDPMSAEARRALEALQSAAAAEAPPATESWDPFAHGDVAEAAEGGPPQPTAQEPGEIDFPPEAAPVARFGEVDLPSAAPGGAETPEFTEIADIGAEGAQVPEPMAEFQEISDAPGGPAPEPMAEFHEISDDLGRPAPEPMAEFHEIAALPGEAAEEPAPPAPAEPMELPSWGELTLPDAEGAPEEPTVPAGRSGSASEEGSSEWSDWSASSGIELPPLAGVEPQEATFGGEPEAEAEPEVRAFAEEPEALDADLEPFPGAEAEPVAPAVPAFAEKVGGPAVVTETMAELLYGQGHLDQAADVYRDLLIRRAGDPALARRLAEIEAEMRGETAAAVGSELERDEDGEGWDGRVAPPPAAPTEETWDGRSAPAGEAGEPPAWLEAVGAVASGVAEGLASAPAPTMSAAAPAQTVSQYLAALLGWRPGKTATPVLAPVAEETAAPEPVASAAEEPAAPEPVASAAEEPAVAAAGAASAEADGGLPFLAPEDTVPVAEPAPAEPAAESGVPEGMPWDEQTLNAPEEQPPLDEPWIAPDAPASALEAAPRDPFADSFAQGFEGAAPGSAAPSAVEPARAEPEAEAMPWTAPAPAPEAEPMPWSAEASPAAPAPAPVEETPWAASEPAAAAPAPAEAMPWESEAAPAEAAGESQPAGGFSFEDFFATPAPAPEPAAPPAPAPVQPSAPAPAASAPSAPPAPSAGGEEDEDLESFQAWLQSLKR